MTLEQAIDRYTNNAEYERIHGSLQGCLDFRQLAEWLKDYKRLLEQQPKTGHWIFQKIKYGEHLAPMRMWCSNCNSAFDLCCNQIKRYDEATKKEYLWGHCPWCGAKMVEPQESEE